MRPQTTNKSTQTSDVRRFSFESAGALALETNTQGLPSYRLTILPSQNASVHVPGQQFITLGGTT